MGSSASAWWDSEKGQAELARQEANERERRKKELKSLLLELKELDSD